METLKIDIKIVISMAMKNAHVSNTSTETVINIKDLIELLNELSKGDKVRGLPSIYRLFAKSLIISIIQEHKY